MGTFKYLAKCRTYLNTRDSTENQPWKLDYTCHFLSLLLKDLWSCSIHERNQGNSEPTLMTSYRWHLFYHNQAELHHKTKATYYFLYSPLHFCSYFYVVCITSWEERNCYHECAMKDKGTWVSLQDKHFSCFL